MSVRRRGTDPASLLWPVAVLVPFLLSACASGGGPRSSVDLDRQSPEAAICSEVAALLAVEEHKPAADRFAELTTPSDACGTEIRKAVELSERIVRAADDHILTAARFQRRGDLLTARRSLLAALDVYPRYHWAARLERNLRSRIETEKETLRTDAAEHRTGGDLRSEVVTLAQLVGLEEDRESSPRLYEAAEELAGVDIRLAMAAELDGNLEGAARLLARGLNTARSAAAVLPVELSPFGELVDYCTRLGLKLFSSGELSQAQSLWRLTVDLDPQNPQLADYLQQVDDRLRGLERIKAEINGDSPP